MSGFPERGADLRGSPGNFPGKSGKLPGNLWIAVKFHSERTSREVAEKLPGKFGDSPEAWGSLTPSQRLAKSVSKKKPHPFKIGVKMNLGPKTVAQKVVLDNAMPMPQNFACIWGSFLQK